MRHPFRWLRASVLWGARSGDDVSTSILADFASGWNKVPASPRRLPARTRPASRSPREERVLPGAAVRAGPRPAPRDPDLGHGGAHGKRCGVGGRIHAAAGGRPERLTTTEPRDRFLEPPQASRLRHGLEATALPHRGPPIQPQARARARARGKRDRHMQPVRQDHHPGGPQALNNHLGAEGAALRNAGCCWSDWRGTWRRGGRGSRPRGCSVHLPGRLRPTTEAAVRQLPPHGR